MAPAPAHVEPRKHIDLETVRAVIVNRMHVLRAYTRHVTLPVFRDELRIAGGKLSRRVRKLLVREPVAAGPTTWPPPRLKLSLIVSHGAELN